MKDTIWIKKGRFTPLAVVLMFAFPLVTALICLCFGRMNVPVGEVLTALRTALTSESASNVQNYSIVINLRLPRILMAIIVGAGLSCAGNTYQSLFSNPLATPDILGVTSGTCVGAILAIILSCSILETQLIALVFGLISVCFTLKIAGKSDGRSMVYLVLAGTIASSLFNALGSLLKYTADPQDKLPEITYWLMGSFTSASYQKILIGCPLIVAGIIIIYLLRWRLNILSLSDDEARASGINIKQTRIEDTKKWVLSPERKAPQATREYAAHRLDGVLDKFLKTMQTTATRLQEKLLRPEIRQKGKDQVKEKARDSVLQLLSRLQAEQMQRKPGDIPTAEKSENRFQ